MKDKKYNEGVIESITIWINNNLDQRLSIDDIADKAGYSKWYLQKLFARCQNETLARYIRRRKLSACVHELKNTRTPIISLAVKYHFESQQSFTRSFKQVMGCTPCVCRKKTLSAETQSKLQGCQTPCELCLKERPMENERKKRPSTTTQYLALSPSPAPQASAEPQRYTV